MIHLPSLRAYHLRSLNALLETADKLAEIIKESWLLFVDVVNQIQDRGAWKLEAPTWDSYCQKRWHISASRISQFRSAAPYALALGNIAEGENENQIRLLKKVIPVESPHLKEVYQLANAVNEKPTEAIYRHALDVIETSARTGVYQLGDSTLPIYDEASKIEAVQASLKMAQKVAIEGKSTRIIVKARKQGDLWQLEADCELPSNFEFSYFVKG